MPNYLLTVSSAGLTPRYRWYGDIDSARRAKQRYAHESPPDTLIRLFVELNRDALIATADGPKPLSDYP